MGARNFLSRKGEVDKAPIEMEDKGEEGCKHMRKDLGKPNGSSPNPER